MTSPVMGVGTTTPTATATAAGVPMQGGPSIAANAVPASCARPEVVMHAAILWCLEIRILNPCPKRFLNVQACRVQIEHAYPLRFEHGRWRTWALNFGMIFAATLFLRIGWFKKMLVRSNRKFVSLSHRIGKSGKPLNTITLLQRRQAKWKPFVGVSKFRRRKTYLEALPRKEKHAAALKAKTMRTKRFLQCKNKAMLLARSNQGRSIFN